MKIGILTFYRVANFGANLQALSTYRYLENHGHTPIMINYYDKEWFEQLKRQATKNIQVEEHLRFVDKYMSNQTELCFSVQDINNAIFINGIENIIVGSDAVVQHHPLLSRLARGKRKPFYITPISDDRVFPNPLWGVGITDTVRMALMSGSSQNSNYKLFSFFDKKKMQKALSRFVYLSVRDKWTYNIFNEVLKVGETNLTPDPVFAFNNNVQELIPNKQQILDKYNLPENYILVSLRGQCVSVQKLEGLMDKFLKIGLKCVALPMPEGVTFCHPFQFEIPIPLSPLDWYSLIKYSKGYVGCNMHPIVVCLHNAVPCYSIDNWGTRDWRGKSKSDGSSKVEDILRRFGLDGYRASIELDGCNIDTEKIIDCITNFPQDEIMKTASELLNAYNNMMVKIIRAF